MPIAGRLIHRLGASRAISMGALGAAVAITFLPLSTHLAWILSIQVLAGVSLACVDLAGFLLMLETLDQRERTSLMSAYMLFTCLAQATGSLLGAGLLGWLGTGAATYTWIFLLSGVLRVLVIFVRPARKPVRATVVS